MDFVWPGFRRIDLCCLLLGSSLAPFLAGCGRSGTSSPERSSPPPPKVTVVTPEVRKVIDWDDFTGRLAAVETVDIRARVTGYLQEVHFKEGAEIKEGDLLVSIDPRPYQAVVERMEARVTSAKSRSELTAKELENVTKLQGNGSISAEDFDRRAKAASDAEGLLRAAEAELRAAKLDLEFTEVRSPITGRVSDARVTKGNLVKSEGQESTLLTTVVSLDPIYCMIEVDERSVLKYRQLHREGKRVSAQFGRVEAEMELADESGFPHKGFIDFVDNRLDAATGTIRARAVFPNPDKLMAPGFFARVRVPGSGEYEGFLIPDRAIADDQGTSHVWVIGEDDIATYRKVTTGPLLDGLRIIREGIAAGDRVVVDGLMAVRNGRKVNPRALEAAEPEAAGK
jgi:RND family efflux transporter MFP subunit